MRVSRRSLVFDLTVLFSSIAVLAYFGWYGYYGPRSFETEKTVEAQVVKYQAELASIEEKRDRLDARVALLRPQSIDPDMLDEMARKTLLFAKQGDFIIPEKGK